MRLLSVIIAGGLLAGGLVVAGSTHAQTDKPAVNDGLRQELLQRTKEDQAARKRLISLGSQADAKATEAVAEIDRKNTLWLKGIIAKQGWPGKSLVKTDGAHAAWLLVQHADQDRTFQKECLNLMQEAFKKSEVSGTDLAYLTDRILVGENKKQIYGTQFRQEGSELAPYPIEDPGNVDKRRKEVGLSTMAAYEKQIRQMYAKPATKKETKPG